MAFLETPARKLLFSGGGASIAGTVADAGPGFDVDGDGAGPFFSALWELIAEKAAELAAFFPGILCTLINKADEFFPPETRPEKLEEWQYLAATVVLPAIALLWLAWYFCAGAARRGDRRTIVALGRRRRRTRMPRDAFEDDPRRYFRDLRAKEPLDPEYY